MVKRTWLESLRDRVEDDIEETLKRGYVAKGCQTFVIGVALFPFVMMLIGLLVYAKMSHPASDPFGGKDG